MTPTPEQAAYILRRLDHERWLKAALDLAAAIEKRGIAVVCLKGPVLAERIYRDPAERRYADIDLMVRRADADAAGAALEEIGYAPSLGGLTLAENRRLEYNTPYLRPGAPMVELHFRLIDMPGAALDADAFIERRRPYALRPGATAYVLEPEDEFLYLCAHGSHHHFEDLKWLRDLDLYLAQYGALRWDVVAARAGECGFRTAVWVALQTLRDRLGREIPGGALAIRPSWLMRLGWPGVVPDSSGGQCSRWSWGIHDAVYVAALCDRLPSVWSYLSRRAFRFARREFVRRSAHAPR